MILFVKTHIQIRKHLKRFRYFSFFILAFPNSHFIFFRSPRPKSIDSIGIPPLCDIIEIQKVAIDFYSLFYSMTYWHVRILFFSCFARFIFYFIENLIQTKFVPTQVMYIADVKRNQWDDFHTKYLIHTQTHTHKWGLRNEINGFCWRWI